MRMLTRDQEYFTRKFAAAQDFLADAELRMECYALAMKDDRNEWEDRRLGEVLYHTACSDDWFREQLASDMKISTDELECLSAELDRPQVGEFIHIFDGGIEGCVHNIEEPSVGPKGTLRITVETEPDQPQEDMEVHYLTRDQYQIV